MLTFYKLAKGLLKLDRTTFLALRTVNAMQGDQARPIAREILGFVNHHYEGGDPLADYADRTDGLRRLQREFEATGQYPARSYSEVKPVEHEAYKLALLLSIICTNHRFEILKELRKFLQASLSDTPQRLLSIGYGTGYELKLAREVLPEWSIEAFDNAEGSLAYATDLLAFFSCRPVTLRQETFPLETANGLGAYRSLFGKIVVCELLEHLEKPAVAIKHLSEALHDQGQMFLTMAVNIAQEDHVFLYSSVQQARQQVLDCGLRIRSEMLAPVVMLPFEEREREGLFRKGNYICTVEKAA